MNFIQDIRYAFRMLRKNGGFTAVVVITLALGIGANAAIFSLTDQVLLRKLPVQRPEELVVLRSDGPISGRLSSDGDNAQSFSYPMYKDIRDRVPVFAGVLARSGVGLSVAGRGSTERASGELVSGNYFQVLGVPATLGRTLLPDDEGAPGANPVAVLSHGYWQRRFGSDPGILNQQLLINGHSLTVVGVAAPGFTGVQIGFVPEVFIPITMKPQMTPNWEIPAKNGRPGYGLSSRRDWWFNILARLKPGMTIEEAQAGAAPAFRSILDEEIAAFPNFRPDTRERYLNKKLELMPGAGGRQVLQRDSGRALVVLSAMVGVVLLIACANIAGLLIVRSMARQREVAVRLALGASRWQLLRLMLIEAMLLAVAGGVAGLLVAVWAMDVLIGAIPEGVGASGLSSNLDARVLMFSVGLSLLTGLLFGLLPAWRATKPALAPVLKDVASSTTGGVPHVWFRRSLVVAQVALTLLLLVGGALFARSMHNLSNVDLGLRTENLLMFSIRPELNGYSSERTIALFDQLRAALSGVPGVSTVSTAELASFEGNSAGSNITVEGYKAAEDEDMTVSYNTVGPAYFSTVGVPLISGREFTDADTAAAPKVAVINETMAKKWFAGQNPIGMKFAWGAGDKVVPNITVVGVVRDNKHSEVRQKPEPFLWQPYAQESRLGSSTFYVRTVGDPLALANSIRSEVRRLDANLPVGNLKTVEKQISDQLFADRLMMTLSVSFAALAALLASIGIYGVMAYSVVQRTREIGIRVALGATQSNVRGLVLREALIIAAIGLLIGVPATYAVGKYAEGILFGVTGRDPWMMAAAAVLLCGVTLLAGFLPARRAARIDPMVALRYE